MVTGNNFPSFSDIQINNKINEIIGWFYCSITHLIAGLVILETESANISTSSIVEELLL